MQTWTPHNYVWTSLNPNGASDAVEVSAKQGEGEVMLRADGEDHVVLMIQDAMDCAVLLISNENAEGLFRELLKFVGYRRTLKRGAA